MPKSFKNTAILLDRIWGCESSNAVFDCVADYGRSLGFEYAIMTCCCPMLISPGKLPPFHMNGPPEWAALYARRDFMSVSPVAQMAMRNTSPFTTEAAFADSSADVDNLRQAARAFGLEFGWFIPVHLADMPSGLIGFGGKDEVKLTSFQRAQSAVVAQLAYEKASGYFIETMAEADVKLSDRERSVLTLVARGKTNWEVGTVLSISEYSVRDYLKSLSKKLETSNRTHTVARAMQLGLIVP